MARQWIALALAGIALGTPASAEDKYPTKPVRMVVPYGPGGATDITSRIVGDGLKAVLGQSFVTDNKPGAFGITAIEDMARARPDGSTLMIGNVSTLAITPVLFASKFSIDYDKDVTMVARLVDTPAVVVITASNFPPTNFAEFIAYAKAHPGAVRYGTTGAGSYPHFDAEVLGKRAGIVMTAIHNKNGAGPMLTDLVNGDIQMSFYNATTALPMIKAGKLRAIAVVNPTQLDDYPGVPTMDEVGFSGVGTRGWQAMMAPAATPKPVLDTLSRAVNETLDSPKTRDALLKQNFVIIPTKSPEEAQQFLRDELKTWKEVVRDVKIDVAE